MAKWLMIRYFVRVMFVLASIVMLASFCQWWVNGKVVWLNQTVAVCRMGFAYTNAVRERYGTIVAPTAVAHQQVTDEMTIDGDDMGAFQKKHGLTVGNNSSGIILSWWWRIANE